MSHSRIKTEIFSGTRTLTTVCQERILKKQQEHFATPIVSEQAILDKLKMAYAVNVMNYQNCIVLGIVSIPRQTELTLPHINQFLVLT